MAGKEIQVYQCVTDEYVTMTSIGRLQFVGKSFGIDELTDGKIYDIVGIDKDDMFRVVDDSGEDYLYYIKDPGVTVRMKKKGDWRLIDDYTGELSKFKHHFID